MSIIEQFVGRWHELERTGRDRPMELPSRIATAAADTLPGVAGAAICLVDTDGARLPIGVSGPEAALAEQLEFTVGDGPGLHAHRTASVVVAGHHFGRRWPVFHDALLTHTSLRAARVVPLAATSADWSAVMMLYHRSADTVHDVDVADLLGIADVADVIACAVMCSLAEWSGWIRRPDGPGLPRHIGQRLAVDVATGMVSGAQRLDVHDALDVMRGHSYAHDRTVDDTATRLVTGEIDVSSL